MVLLPSQFFELIQRDYSHAFSSLSLISILDTLERVNFVLLGSGSIVDYVFDRRAITNDLAQCREEVVVCE